MTSLDFRFTRSKVKVTMMLYWKMWFPLIFLRAIYHRAIIFHMLINLGEKMAPVDFGFTRLKDKVTRITC